MTLELKTLDEAAMYMMTHEGAELEIKPKDFDVRAIGSWESIGFYINECIFEDPCTITITKPGTRKIHTFTDEGLKEALKESWEDSFFCVSHDDGDHWQDETFEDWFKERQAQKDGGK